MSLLLALSVTISNAQDPPASSRLPPVPEANDRVARNDDGEPTPAAPQDAANLFPDGLSLADVIASLYRSYPEIAAARAELRRTNGEFVSAYGAFDLKLEGYSLNEPTGFYENHRHAINVARQTWWGGYLSAGYRIGRGAFQPWYKERETDKSGEFKLGLVQPLLQGRAIDLNRLAVFQASLARQATQPIIQQAILDSAREATQLYWQWVSSGQVLMAQRELLALAASRGQQFQEGVAAGKFAEIDLILNQQLIAERSGKLLESQQKFQAVGFKLSLFLRDPMGRPLVATEAWLPGQFPATERPRDGDLPSDLANALARRPEPRILQYAIRQVQYERQVACNNLLPAVDFVAEASQDVGPAASQADDKDQFLLLVGLQTEVPLQRRKARGKLQSTAAKITQLRQKLRLLENKIEAELRTAYNSLQLASQIVDQAELSLRAAFDSLDRYRFAFERGKIDLIYLNLLETKANETEIKLIEAQGNWFSILGQMQAALGLDPLEQALLVAELPQSRRPGPGRLPQGDVPNEERFQRDWQLRTAPAPE